MLNCVKAFLLMIHAHKGQKDKAGKPYFLHPLRVALKTKGREAKIVALLHDVVEDNKKYTIDDFKFLNEEQKQALTLLTHNKKQSYEEYIRAISKNEMAKKIKTNDLKDNMNLKRLKNITIKDKERYKKYTKALTILTCTE